jgi:hypothetical protein
MGGSLLILVCIALCRNPNFFSWVVSWTGADNFEHHRDPVVFHARAPLQGLIQNYWL